MDSPAVAETLLCRGCGTHVARALLSCPTCHRLIHSDELKRLAQDADHAARNADPSRALASWRSALELLPAGSRQHALITEKIATLSREVDTLLPPAVPQPASSAVPSHGGWVKGGAAGLGAIALFAWKFKVVLIFVLTKLKLLLLGLTKASTVFSMFAALGVYWSVWGWKFALGVVLCTYVHEMGHVAALKRFGIAATAPMFLPGIGAIVRLKQYPADAREDARVGLAGPLWGLAASLAVYVAHLGTGWGSLAAIAEVNAWINLFNLLPLGSLDGGRGFRAMSRSYRWAAVAAIAVMWAVSAEPMMVLLLLVGAFRAIAGPGCDKPDRMALAQYVFLVAALGLLCLVPVPIEM